MQELVSEIPADKENDSIELFTDEERVSVKVVAVVMVVPERVDQDVPLLVRFFYDFSRCSFGQKFHEAAFQHQPDESR